VKRFDVARDTIFVTRAGSRAHGTARPESDVDLRGVAIAPLEQRLSYREAFEQYEGPLPPELGGALGPRVEATVFDVQKLVRLAVDANPNALEILFASPEDWVFSTPAWQRLHAARRLFLSRKVEQTYAGYALAQLRRIQTHRSWLLSPPARRPVRADFGLPERRTLSHDDRHRIERAIADKIRSWGVDDIDLPKPARILISERLTELWTELGEPRLIAASALGISENVFEALEAERRYRGALKHFESFERWKRERNPARAELEARFGYDTKHAMHLIRLMRSGLELLETGELCVRRPDAAELVAIREGERSYEDVVAEAERLRERMLQVREKSPLPADVDHDRIDALLFELVTGSERR
jgi:predicted nucleotidyltransferase